MADFGAIAHDQAHLFFAGASVREAQAHDGAYLDNRVLLVHKVMQQRVSGVVLVLHRAIEDAHGQQRPCTCSRLSE